MTLDKRTQALLDLVEDDRRTQNDATLTRAQAQADALLMQARTEAHQRVREVFAEERQRAQARVAAARATLQTRRRLHEQRHTAAWLALGWLQLPGALRARWRDYTSRRLWITAAVQSASRALPRGAWRIGHADGWAAAEQQALSQQLQHQLGTAPVFMVDAAIEAGLRINASGNGIDATLVGLLADRNEIGAALLNELAELEVSP